jgi:hypothetical protein
MKHACLAAVAASVLLAAVPAGAACFKPLGCTDTDFFRRTDLAQQRCELLWKMRNTILKERGLCFEDERAVAAFGNAGCRHEFANTLLLNSAERENVTNIRAAEKAKRCSR